MIFHTASTDRLRQFRTEAVRTGFADCFKRQDYSSLIKVAEDHVGRLD